MDIPILKGTCSRIGAKFPHFDQPSTTLYTVLIFVRKQQYQSNPFRYKFEIFQKC